MEREKRLVIEFVDDYKRDFQEALKNFSADTNDVCSALELVEVYKVYQGATIMLIPIDSSAFNIHSAIQQDHEVLSLIADAVDLLMNHN